MSVSFEKSTTRINLMKAFAGESQARNRYTFAASEAKKGGLHIIESAFLFTANQEKEHAELFYKYLKPLSGQNIPAEGKYPVDIHDNAIDLLKSARRNEYEEYDTVYKAFGDEAELEGFGAVAETFRMIAEIEKTHGDRFDRFIKLLEENKLFVSDVEAGWICLNCGYVYRGTEVPKMCPVCKHDRGYFLRLDLMHF
ncbi:MAG: rubrerythrin family protein [Oscillospiraceae bacterium]|jgi:rubrerythrin|nr:rubrerythrin family protein [Oscillospiraceae bacterium]